MRCLVTGGAGFIGSHLVKKLHEMGHEVFVLDNAPIEGRYSQHYVTNICGDVTKELYGLLNTPTPKQFDWCFHLAALADIVPSIEDPVKYYRVNVGGTVNTIDYCMRTGGLKKFVFASSTSVYGIPVQYPTPENETPAPQYPYALTKHLAEQYVMYCGRFYQLPVISLRITTAYGPGMKSKAYGSAFKVFMAQKANKAPFTVVGDGSQSRDFVFVDDVVDAFIKAAESDVSGEIFNVGCGEPRTIHELINCLGGGEVVYLPRRPGEPDKTHADIRKIYVMLRWEPKVSLEEGTRVMLEHLDDWKGEFVWTPESIGRATETWFKHLS